MNAVAERTKATRPAVARAKKAATPAPIAVEANAAATVARTALDLIDMAAKNPSWGYEGGCGDLAAHGNVATDFVTTLLEQAVESTFDKRDAIEKFSVSETVLLGLLAFDQRDDPEALERQSLIKQAAELLGSARLGVDCVPYAFTQLADGIAAAKATAEVSHTLGANSTPIAIEGNEPGMVHVQDREELQYFLLKQSSAIASLSALFLRMLEQGNCSGEWFMADVAKHLNHLIYQQENATKLLLDKGDAK
ncbi:MAG: hypothetical protein WBC18_14620 [Ottowia sp.]|uniref:hypothetical protein n=1 Tax=Ottowia sp. TaxID=1898956 RepID=UPI003C728807